MTHQISQRRRSRALPTVVVSTILAGALALVAAAPAQAVQDVVTHRIGGQDRFETAAEIARAAYPDGSDTAVVTSGRDFPDALAGAPLGFPLLLTERDTLPVATNTALDDLEATDVIILGGTGAVSTEVEEGIEGLGYDVERIGGTNRYETAALIAEEIGATGVADLDGKATAFIATGRDFADALAGGPLATAGDGTKVHPILLTEASVPVATLDALEELGIEQVVILGGTAAVSSAVEKRLEDETGNPAIRIAGDDRFGTGVAVAEAAYDDFGFPTTDVLLASGRGFADALAGGPLGAVTESPILLTEVEQLPEKSKAFFVDHADTLTDITALGGTAAVSESALEAAEVAAETPAVTRVNEAYDVTPQDAATQANGTARAYTAAVGANSVDIVIVPCANVTTGADGNTRFANANKTTVADGTSASDPSGDDDDDADEADTPAWISSVNGTARQEDNPLITPDYVNSAAPTSGVVTFEVTGPSGTTPSTCVVPVVFSDDNANNGLNVPATTNPALPTEAFGTGGAVTYGPAGSTGGFFDVDIDSSTDSANSFVGCDLVLNEGGDDSELVDSEACVGFTYDDNDVFQIGGVPKTISVFEVALTKNDDIKGTYKANPAESSTFNLYSDEAPEPPNASLTDVEEGSNSVTVTFFESSNNAVDSYRLFRATQGTGGTCSAFSSGYSQVATTPDLNPSSTPSEDSQLTITDTTATPDTAYCYVLVSVDDGDPGPGSGVIEATTTDATDDDGPTLTDATSPNDDDGVVSAGDEHVLTFDEPMGNESAGASYDVTDAEATEATIQCGVHAICAIAGDVITATITPIGGASELVYPLTIDALAGFVDAAGNEATLGDDDTIEGADAEPEPEPTGPVITEANGSSENTGFNSGDVHELVFDEEMDDETESGSYTVTGTPVSSPVTVECGTPVDAEDDVVSATCDLSEDGMTLTVTIVESPAVLTLYPLEITATDGFTAGDVEVDLASSADTTIEQSSMDG